MCASNQNAIIRHVTEDWYPLKIFCIFALWSVGEYLNLRNSSKLDKLYKHNGIESNAKNHDRRKQWTETIVGINFQLSCPMIQKTVSGLAQAKIFPDCFLRLIRLQNSLAKQMTLPPNSYMWQRYYDQRPAKERICSRVDQAHLANNHFLWGKARLRLKFTIGFTVMVARACVAVKSRRPDQMRSCVSSLADWQGRAPGVANSARSSLPSSSARLDSSAISASGTRKSAPDRTIAFASHRNLASGIISSH